MRKHAHEGNMALLCRGELSPWTGASIMAAMSAYTRLSDRETEGSKPRVLLIYSIDTNGHLRNNCPHCGTFVYPRPREMETGGRVWCGSGRGGRLQHTSERKHSQWDIYFSSGNSEGREERSWHGGCLI